jgi:SAM-dependent methyltransferase
MTRGIQCLSVPSIAPMNNDNPEETRARRIWLASRRPVFHIARSLDADSSLVAVLPALFAGMPSLGRMSGAAVRLLRDSGLRRNHRVLDLACGKGPVAVELARKVGCSVLAIDGYEPFLAEGAERARRRGVSHLVTWVASDVRRLPPALTRSRFHASVMLGLEPLPAAAKRLRALTLPGGVYLFDDCVVHPRCKRIPVPLAHIPTLEHCRAMIETLGDTVEQIEIPTASHVRAVNERLYGRLATNAATVLREHPRLRAAIREFLRRHRRANSLLQGPLRPCVWIIRRR